MENIEFLQGQLSLAGEIAVSHKNNILTVRIFLKISGRKQISAQPVINGTTVLWSNVPCGLMSLPPSVVKCPLRFIVLRSNVRGKMSRGQMRLWS